MPTYDTEYCKKQIARIENFMRSIKSISQDTDYFKLLENAQVIDRCIADLKSTCADINSTLVAYGNSSLSRKMAAHTNRMMLRISIMERGGM